MSFSNMTREELSKAIEEMEQELARREQLTTVSEALEDVASSFLQLSLSLSQLRGGSQHEVMLQYLPSDFIDWVSLGGSHSSPVVGEWSQPTYAETVYNKGDRVTQGGITYESLEDGNRYSPVAYPQGWKAL